MKKSVQLLLAGSLFSSLALAQDVVNLYSHRHYDVDKKLYEMFEKQTGIKVNVIKDKASLLIKKIKEESENTPADLLMTADVARLYAAEQEGILQPIKSDYVDKVVPKHLMDDDKNWVAVTKRARIVVYAKDRVKESDLSTYEDLADPKWKNKIVTRTSSHPYNQSLLASIIAANGKEKAEKWAQGLVNNFARTPKGNDRAQVVAIANGIGDLAIVNTYYIGKMLTNSKLPDQQEAVKKVKVFFPNQDGRGAHINISGVGLTKYSKNKENATKFVEFLLSKEAQEVFAAENFEYPVVEGVKVSPVIEAFGKFKADTVPLYKLGENNAEAVKIADKVGWK